VDIKLPDDKKKEPLREKVARIIQESVLRGALKPGEQLVEAVLARKMNVSRAPLREAFLILERQGYVHVIPNRGTYVVNLTPADVTEIFLLRYALEPMAAQSASKNLVLDEKQKLAAIFSVMRESINQEDYRRYYENELRFHQKIWSLSGNRRLEDILNGVCLPLFTFRIVNSRPPRKQLVQSLNAYEAILEEIQNGDATRLEGLIRISLQGLTC
jgi:DNA-binding GntR family transcriptional regulator